MKHLNRATVLCCNLNGTKAAKIKMAAVKLGLRIHTVSPDEFTLPLGRLVGLPAYADAEPLEGEPFTQEMLIFHEFTEPQLDAFLAEIRRAGGVRLKAVVTPTNASWCISALYRELEAEHAAIQQRRQAHDENK